MTRPTRYRTQTLVATLGGVSTHRGMDPLTGLPVLIYAFEGRPAASVGELESENIPGILESVHEGGEGRVVAAYSPDYRPLGPGPHPTATLLEAARGLRDAAEAGVTHGDLRPERFLVAEGHVLLEGYGVPWRATDDRFRAPELEPAAGGSYAGDVYAWAASLRALGGAGEPPAAALLARCLAADPDQRPTARELYDGLEALVPAPAREGAAAADIGRLAFDLPEPDEAPAPADPSELEFDLNVADEPPRAPAAAPAHPARREWPSQRTQRLEHGAPISFDDEEGGLHDPHEDAAFVKDLPPGATYRAGTTEGAPRPAAIRPDGEEPELGAAQDRRAARRSWWLLGLVLAAGVLAYLAFRGQNAAPITAGANERTVYVVQIDVEPRTMPPVKLRIVSSPPGATLSPGTEYGTVPPSGRPITLNTAGEWAFQGVFLDRASEVVTLRVPDDLRATLVFPPVDAPR